MRVIVYLPLVLSAALACSTCGLTRRLAPAAAARALAGLAALAATASTWGLVLLALTLLDRSDMVADRTTLSGQQLAAVDPVPPLVAVTAAAALACGAVRLVVVARSRLRAGRALCRLCRSCPGDGLLTVVPVSEPLAFAVPGRCRRPGRIVVTRGMLQALDPDERRVLLAHEGAHLFHAHSRFRAVTEAAAAVNPLLRRPRNEVTFLVERWADEDAAIAVRSRPLVARALARAALAHAGSHVTASHLLPLSPHELLLPFERLEVTERVRALQQAEPRSRRLALAACLAMAGATAYAAVHATLAFAQLIAALGL